MRRIRDSRSSVVLSGRVLTSLRVLATPGPHFADHRFEFLTTRRQRVFDAERPLADYRAVDDTSVLQIFEVLGQNFAGYLTDSVLQRTESQCVFFEQLADNDRVPLLAEEFTHLRQVTVVPGTERELFVSAAGVGGADLLPRLRCTVHGFVHICMYTTQYQGNTAHLQRLHNPFSSWLGSTLRTATLNHKGLPLAFQV